MHDDFTWYDYPTRRNKNIRRGFLWRGVSIALIIAVYIFIWFFMPNTRV